MGYAELPNGHYIRWWSGDTENGLSDDNISLAHTLLQHAGFEKTLFFDRDTPLSRLEFAHWVKDTDKLCYMIFRADGTPIAMTWLTEPSRTGKQVYAHFTTLGTIVATPAECMEAGKKLIRWWGAHLGLLQLIGITPACYRHALDFAYGLGFKKLTVLKKIANVFGKERDAVLSICNINEV